MIVCFLGSEHLLLTVCRRWTCRFYGSITCRACWYCRSSGPMPLKYDYDCLLTFGGVCLHICASATVSIGGVAANMACDMRVTLHGMPCLSGRTLQHSAQLSSLRSAFQVQVRFNMILSVTACNVNRKVGAQWAGHANSHVPSWHYWNEVGLEH